MGLGWLYAGGLVVGTFLLLLCFASWFVALGSVVLGLDAAMLGYLGWWATGIAAGWVIPCYFSLRLSGLDSCQP